jgi:hypothetical protein
MPWLGYAVLGISAGTISGLLGIGPCAAASPDVHGVVTMLSTCVLISAACW